MFTQVRALVLPAFLMATATLYFASIPIYLQGGDSAEFVSAAQRILVAHPPGYPLWIWMQSLWLKVFPYSTEFWRASLLTCIVALNGLALLLWPLRRSGSKVAMVASLVVLSPVYFETSILPDVFALHGLFIILLASSVLYLEGTQRLRGTAFIAMLSLANHHTMIFMLPVLVVEFWLATSTQRKTLIHFAALGATLCALLYLSILFMNPSSAYSWGQIDGISSLLRHVLRIDYGTFQLQAQGQGVGFQPFTDFAVRTLLPLAGLILFCAYLGFRHRLFVQARPRAVLVSLVLSCLFFLIANIQPQGIGAEVLLRFHLMPLLLIFVLCGYVLKMSVLNQGQKVLGLLVTIAPALFMLPDISGYLRLRSDSVIEDYALNLLRGAEARKPALIIVDTDSAFFAVRNLLATQNSTEVTVATKSMFFHSWFQAKTKSLIPTLTILNADRIANERRMNLKEDLISPNVGNLTVLVTSGFQDGKDYHTQFLPLGRNLKAGNGVTTDYGSIDSFRRRTFYSEPPKGPQAFTRGLLYSGYSHIHLIAKNWEGALKAVPYCYPALNALCMQNGTDLRCTEEPRAQIKNQSAPFF